MQHARRTLRVTVATIVAALPVIAADADVQHFVGSHPWLAAYLPVATAIVYALYRAATRPALAPATTPPPAPDGAAANTRAQT